MKKPLALFVLAAALAAVNLSCAAPSAPQPPSLRLSRTVDNLTAVRKGRRVVLSWSTPTETTDRQNVRWPTVTRICRAVNQFPVDRCVEVVAVIRSSELSSSQPTGRRPLVSFEDVLPANSLDFYRQATYAVEVLNAHGRSAGLSNQVRVALTPTEEPPQALHAVLDAQGPLLSWRTTVYPWTAAGVTHRLRVYRRASGQTAVTLVADEPWRVGEDAARDSTFEWEKTYEYWITTATEVASATHPTIVVEGDDSPIVSLLVHDTFPPAVPTGLEAVFSSVGQQPFIDLTWTPNGEEDLAGYLVYRRQPGGEFVPLTREPVPAPAWRDTAVQAGAHYEYAVRAVDQRGNQSALSEVAGEAVPAAQEEK